VISSSQNLLLIFISVTRIHFKLEKKENITMTGRNIGATFNYLFLKAVGFHDHLCGLVVRVPGYRSRGLGSIYSSTRFSEK
jgi:hypothetical protein